MGFKMVRLVPSRLWSAGRSPIPLPIQNLKQGSGFVFAETEIARRQAAMSRDTEYQTLRTEILDKSGRQFNMVSFALTVTVALIGYGLTNANALIFLVPLLMLALILIHLVRNIYAILRITSYIRLFIEPEEKDQVGDSHASVPY
jgi:hypothetical protein